MNNQDFLVLLNDLMELDPDTLRGDEVLEGLDSWDSLAVIGFIALVDEKFGITLSPQKIYDCQTVNDLVALLDKQSIPQ